MRSQNHLALGVSLWVLLLAGTTSAMAQADTSFDTGCGELPFQSIAKKHPIDDHCGIEGVTAPTDTGNQQQNRLKNNFCLKSTPVVVKPADLVTLQKKVDGLTGFKYGSGRSVPKDRTPLQNIGTSGGKTIGEGTLVTVVGYMVDAHYSDVKAGEGVNCKQSGNEPNDIHFSISTRKVNLSTDKKAKQAQLCKLVTGEISPHSRPEDWEAASLARVDNVRVRLTGQLFFDASHVPCRPNKPVNPARKSVWEIHPIYRIEVCKDGTQCRATADADWVALDAWIHDQQELEVGEPQD